MATSTSVAMIKARFDSSSIARRFARGASWNLAGFASFRALSAVAMLLVARFLGPQAYGELGMIQSTARLFAVYGGMPFAVASTKFLAEHRKRNPGKAARIFRLLQLASGISCTLVAVALIVSSSGLAEGSLDRPELALPLAFAAVLLWFTAYGLVQEASLAGFEQFRPLAFANIWKGVATIALTAPLAYWYGVTGAIGGMTAAAAVGFAVCFVALRRAYRQSGLPRDVKIRDVKPEIPLIWRFALPGVLSAVMIAVLSWVGRTILVHQDGGYAALGLFEAANQWRAPLTFLPIVLVRVALPILAEAHGRGDAGDFRSALSMQMTTICGISLPISILIAGFSEPLSAFYGAHFPGLATLMPILALVGFGNAMTDSLRRVFDSTDRRWISFTLYCGWAAVFIAATYYLVPLAGAAGFAYAHVAAEMTLLTAQVVYIDLVIAPGALRRHAVVLLLSFGVFGLAWLAAAKLSTLAAIAVAIALSGLSVIAFFLRVRGRKTLRA